MLRKRFHLSIFLLMAPSVDESWRSVGRNLPHKPFHQEDSRTNRPTDRRTYSTLTLQQSSLRIPSAHAADAGRAHVPHRNVPHRRTTGRAASAGVAAAAPPLVAGPREHWKPHYKRLLHSHPASPSVLPLIIFSASLPPPIYPRGGSPGPL